MYGANFGSATSGCTVVGESFDKVRESIDNFEFKVSEYDNRIKPERVTANNMNSSKDCIH